MKHLQNYWWAYLILIIAIYFGIKWYNKNKALKINTGSGPVEGSPCTVITPAGFRGCEGFSGPGGCDPTYESEQIHNWIWQNGVCLPKGSSLDTNLDANGKPLPA